MEIKDLEPKLLWKNFYAITQIPRPSGHLDKIRAFLLDFAKNIGVEAFVDDAGNVIFRKAATKGMENRPVITLQAHMDMVPQKAPGSSHNFETDPIPAYIDGDWVKTHGTTLGADDGMGLAAIMAVMEDDTLRHGPLEALMTVDEETCMYGVNNMKGDTLTGDYLLNLDDESEGEMIIGSAGGVNVSASMKYRGVETEANSVGVKIELAGLLGGHSGLDIPLGHANANKLMARVVRDAIVNLGARLASWQGGNMRNAIPNHCEAVLALPKKDAGKMDKFTGKWLNVFKAEYDGIESNIALTCVSVETPKKIVPEEIQDNIIDALIAVHDGPLRQIPSLPEIVETSSNLAIVQIGDGQALVKFLVRSSSDTMKRFCAETVAAPFDMVGMKIQLDGDYPAWQPNTHSRLVEIMKSVYKKLFGHENHAQVIHAGLECGVIGALYPRMEMVSIGPTTKSPHTPNERSYIPDAKKYYDFVRAIIEDMPAKA